MYPPDSARITRSASCRSRQTRDDRRRRRRGARRHDRRDRRLGIAPQADGARARAAALAGARTSRSCRTAGPTSACSAAPARCSTWSSTRSSRSTRSRSSRTSATRARRATVSTTELDEGHVPARAAGRGVAGAVPPDSRRARLGRDAREPGSRAPCVRRTPTARSSSPCPRSTLDVALVHMHRGDQGGNGQYLGVDPVLRRPHVHGRDEAVHVGREDRRNRGLPEGGPAAVACASTGS